MSIARYFLELFRLVRCSRRKGGAGVVASLGANIKTKVNTINTMTVSIRDNHNERLGRIEEEGGGGGGLRDKNYHIKTQHTCDTF